MDIGLNSDFDITLDHRNDLPLVEGRKAFEQRLSLRVAAYFHQHVGRVDNDHLTSLLDMEARRVARDSEGVQRVAQITSRMSPSAPNTVEMTVIYDLGDEFSLTLSD